MKLSEDFKYNRLHGTYKDATFSIEICDDGIVWVVKNLSIRQTRFGEALTVKGAEVTIRAVVDSGWLFQG